jgi:hypothetical protein
MIRINDVRVCVCVFADTRMFEDDWVGEKIK